MRPLLAFIVLSLCCWHSHGQIVRTHSAGFGGATPAMAANGTLTHFGVVGSALSQNKGALVGAIDYKPAHPASAISVTAYTTNSISLEWAKGNGSARIVVVREGNPVDGFPGDGTLYAADETFGEGAQLGSGNYVVYEGLGNSVMVTGLKPDTEYSFRVFEYNGRYEDNGSNVVYQTNAGEGNPLSHTTFAEIPDAQPASLAFENITATSMTGVLAETEADGYLVLRRQGADPTEVPVDGVVYDNPNWGNSALIHNGPATTFDSPDLVAGTIYHYKVYAYNGHEKSVRYRIADPLIHQKITLPDTPPRPHHTDEGTGTFRIVWTPMQGADGYEIEVSRNEEFTNLLQHYAPKYIPGGEASQHLLEHLATSSYYYRVRAVNSSGHSDYSPFWNVFIAGVVGANDLAVAFTNNARPEAMSEPISVTVTGGGGEKTVTVHWRPIRGEEFVSQPMERIGTGNIYQISVDASVADVMGLEYYVEAVDNTASITTNLGGKGKNDYIYQSVPRNTVIPDLPSGGNTSDYRMISIPYALGLNNAPIIFSSLGDYNKSRWRLLAWNGHEYIDNPSVISPGEAFWFNSRSAATVELGEGTVSRNNQSSPFMMSLRQGWNMVSTPYPFSVSWADILQHNGLSEASEYYVYEGSGYSTTDLLEPWKGGFVFSENSTTLEIPVVFTSSGGGRKKSKVNFTSLPGKGNWCLTLTVRQGANEHRLAGIGMHTDAAEGKDYLDRIALPRFLEFVDLTSRHPEYSYPLFTRDIVPVSDHYQWEFVADGSAQQPIDIVWNEADLQDGDYQLLLYDKTAGQLIDMRTQNQYAAMPGSALQFIFSQDQRYPGSMEETSVAFPNPFTSRVNLPSLINLNKEPVWVDMQIISSTGTTIYCYSGWDDDAVIEPVWEGVDRVGNVVASGVYYFEIVYRSSNHHTVRHGKLLKQ